MYEDDFLESDYEDKNGGSVETDDQEESFEVWGFLFYDPETDELYKVEEF